MLSNRRKYCKNCHYKMDADDKYCAICGTIYGEGSYSPFNDHGCMAAVYGPPPIKRVHECTQCRYTWNSFDMVDRVRYCPKCGEKVNS